jgi:hypothetical protein
VTCKVVSLTDKSRQGYGGMASDCATADLDDVYISNCCSVVSTCLVISGTSNYDTPPLMFRTPRIQYPRRRTVLIKNK